MEPLTREQQIEALRKNLTVADQEKICARHHIGRATYYRIIQAFDLKNKVMLDIVQLAEANKQAADQRAEQAAASLKKLL
ncbi:hypothetical protein [Hymenobacter psychrotolerans]|nr:hypothetical protein [Hymenobacter psychrotolerans]